MEYFSCKQTYLKIMKKKIKIAIVGLGNISTKHIKAIEKSKMLELVAICDKKKKIPKK